jgi:protoporphyrinogen oxidase
MLARMGKAMCECFYFPYAYKIWGLEPEQISSKLADARVKTSELNDLLKKVLSGIRSQPKRQSYFYYPQKGIGQIATTIEQELERCGVTVHRRMQVKQIYHRDGQVKEVQACGDDKKLFSIPTDLLFSTISMSEMISLLSPSLSEGESTVLKPLTFRSIVFLYFVFPVGQFTPFDAHYFPEKKYCFTRISEPKNYAASVQPEGSTGLCVEIPCAPGDEIVYMRIEDLGRVVRKDLENAGLLFPSEPTSVFRKYITNAYPIYQVGYEVTHKKYLNLLSRVRGIIIFGRCGLFVHDNMHHAMAMGYDAAECINQDGSWNSDKWQHCMKQFEAFTVED